MTETPPESVLDFWFKETPSQQWFQKNPDFDHQIQRRFGPALAAAVAGELDAWLESPRGSLAMVILLDQFSRNIYRDDPRAFAGDEKARTITKTLIENGADKEFESRERTFLYMPLMHSEDEADQGLSVEIFEAYSNPNTADFARRHRDIIVRYGRFPHRNKILGRPSTPAEVEFLKQPGSSF